jgi:hypothetical protein
MRELLWWMRARSIGGGAAAFSMPLGGVLLTESGFAITTERAQNLEVE